MTKSVLYGKEGRDKLLSGVKKITDAVRVTMGASGKCVLIGNAVYGNDGMVQLPTLITKDGWTVTQHFQLSDPVENRGALMIREAATKTVEMAGDATTCTCVLAEAIITEGMKLIDEGANSQELKKGIDKAVEDVVEELKKMSIPIKDDNEKIFQVASVSANNDAAIGRLISDAFKKIGPDGVIDIDQSKTAETIVKVAEGLKFDKGWISPLFVNNKAKETCEFENPLILLYEKRITHHTQIETAIHISRNLNRPLFIICEDAAENGLAFLAMNNLQGGIRVCVVKAPEFGAFRDEAMEDLAVITGSTYISDRRGIDIKKVTQQHLGGARKVVVAKGETVIIEGTSDKIKLTELLNDLKMNLTQAKTEADKSVIEKRIARLSGGIAVIEVGAPTETEMNEKLYRVDDAVRATKAAISEGYVAGGGTAFLRIWSNRALEPKPNHTDIQKGEQILIHALAKPLIQMAINNGKDYNEVMGMVLKSNGNEGYNTSTGVVENLIDAGIIDSTKALRCALINAASIAGMMLTSECLIETMF